MTIAAMAIMGVGSVSAGLLLGYLLTQVVMEDLVRSVGGPQLYRGLDFAQVIFCLVSVFGFAIESHPLISWLSMGVAMTCWRLRKDVSLWV